MKSILIIILILSSFYVQAQDQTTTGNLIIGPTDHNDLGYGNGIYFNGNTDNFWFNRFNIASNQTEFRINISDDIAAEDKMAFGTTSFVDGIWKK